MRRANRWVALLAVLAMAAGACGDGDDDEPSAGGGDDLGGADIEVAAVWTGTEQERFQGILDAFEEETGANVTFTSTGDDIAAAIGPRIAGGDPPDVAVLPQPGLLRDYVEQGALQPIEDVAGQALDDNFAPIWRELGTVDGQLYGLWFKAANKSLVWYNTGVFEDAGVEPPENLDEFLSAAQTINDSGVPALSVGGADGWTLTDWFENVYLRTAGPEMYDRLARHEIPWTDASVKETLGTLRDIFNPDYIPGGTDGALQTDFNTSVTQVFTDPPEAAMVFEADFVTNAISETEAEVGTDAQVFDFPEIGDSGPAVVTGGDVATLLKDSEGGRALIEFLASPEGTESWVEAGGFISSNKNLDLDLYPNEVLRSIAEAQFEAEENLRFDLSDDQPAAFGSTPGQGLYKGLQDFLANPGNVDQVTQQLEDAANRAFG